MAVWQIFWRLPHLYLAIISDISNKSNVSAMAVFWFIKREYAQVKILFYQKEILKLHKKWLLSVDIASDKSHQFGKYNSYSFEGNIYHGDMALYTCSQTLYCSLGCFYKWIYCKQNIWRSLSKKFPSEKTNMKILPGSLLLLKMSALTKSTMKDRLSVWWKPELIGHSNSQFCV